MSHCGSTTAATPADVSPTTYEPHPRSSWMIWRKSVAKAFLLSRDSPPRVVSSQPGDSAPPRNAQDQHGDVVPRAGSVVAEDDSLHARRDVGGFAPGAGRERLRQLFEADDTPGRVRVGQAVGIEEDGVARSEGGA